MTPLLELADRVEAATGESNELDVLVEIALFEPCDEFASLRANSAGTKLVFTTVGGSDMTLRAQDWTHTNGQRRRTAAALRARASHTTT